MTSYFKIKRVEDKKYLASAINRRCCICGNPICCMHHIRINTNSGMGIKADDGLTIPLCGICHDLAHDNEPAFYRKYSRIWGDDVIKYAKELYKKYKEQ